MRKGTRAAALAVALVGQSLLVASPGLASGHIETLASNLDSPRGVHVDADGTVYVAESGSGGTEECVEHPELGEMCLGATGGVTMVAPDGTVSQAAGDLPSLGSAEAGEAVGPSDVTRAADGALYVSMGWGVDLATRQGLVDGGMEEAALFGTVIEATATTTDIVADVTAFEAAEDPDADEPGSEGINSNPNAVLSTASGLYVADAGGNFVAEIDAATGDVELVTLFPSRIVPAPPFPDFPETMPMQSVPTSLAASADGSLLVGELTGFPFPAGGAHVWSVDPDTGAVTTAAEDLTHVMDVAEHDGALYVLEIFHQSLLTDPETPSGTIIRIDADGSRRTILTGLVAPGGMAVDSDGMIYVSDCGVCFGGGALLKVDPTMAVDAASAAACPPAQVGGTMFSDLLVTTHEATVTCLAWWGVVSGFEDGTFRPNATITRAQTATLVAGFVEAIGGTLPASPPNAFPDDDGTVHEANINALAAMGIVEGRDDGTFGGGGPVSRGAAIAMLVRAYEQVSGTQLDAGADAFADDDESVFEAAINAAAEAGWVSGTLAGTIDAGAAVTRGQVSTMAARGLATAVVQLEVSLPS